MGQLLLTLLPATLMASAGLMYLWQVKLAVEESLPPALRAYARRQAQLDVQMERVSLHWRGVLLTHPEVRTLTGERLFRARYLDVRLPAQGTPLTVEIDRPEGWLVRDRRGVWNIEPLLRQPRPPEPTLLTLRVVARNGTLYFDDFFPDTPVRATLWAQEFTYSQPRIGQVITVRGLSDALGEVTLHALSDGKRWLIEAHATQAQGSRFKPYLPETEFDLRQAVGQLSLQVVYAPDAPLRVQGTVRGVALGASYRRQPLPWQAAEFQLAFTESGLSGVLRARRGDLEARFSTDWSGRSVAWAAQGRIAGADAAQIWRLLRKDKPLVQGRYQLQFRLEGDLENLQGAGIATLERFATPAGELRRLNSPFRLTARQLSLPTVQAEYAGRPVKGKLWVNLRPQSPEFRLYAIARHLPLTQVLPLREQQLRGEADVALLAYGSVEKPTVEANLFSDALFYEGQRLGGARARVRYADGKLHIPIALLQGAAGLVQVSGEILDFAQDDPRFDLSVDASELDLNLLAQLLGYAEGELLKDGDGRPLRVEGVGYLTAQIRGSVRTPEAVAEAVIFDGRLGDIGAEITVANLNLLGRELRITSLQILRRAAQLIATGTVQLPPQPDQPPRFQLQGNLYEFDLAAIPDWLRRDLPLTGLASGSFEAEGEPQRLTVRAQLHSESIQYDKLLMRENRAQATVEVSNGQTQVTIESAQAQVGEGVLDARGQWRSDNAFALQWQLQNASLETLAPYLPVEYQLRGRVSVVGEAAGTLDAPQVNAQLEGRELTLNGVALGALTAQVRYSPHSSAESEPTQAGTPSLHAHLTLHTPDGSVRLSEFTYTPEGDAVAFEAETEPLPIDWLRRVVRAVPDAAPPAVIERLETLQGKVQARVRVAGTLREPQAQLTLNADTLEWRQQSLGGFNLRASWQGEADVGDLREPSPIERARETLRRLRTQRAELTQLRWQAGATRLEAKGTYTPDALTADLEVAQLPLSWARLWEPTLPEFEGNLDLSMIAQGNPESPELTLSATVSNFTYGGYTVDQILFSQIDVREGAIQTDDALIRMRDYQARLSGRLPFHWSPLSIPNDEPIQLQARLREQPLSLLSLFVPIDVERTDGTIEASLEIGGTLAEPQPRGRLQIANGALALKELRTVLREIGLEVEFDGREARITQAQARSSEGGAIRAEGSVTLTGEQPTANLRVIAESLTANEPKLPVLEGSARAVVSGALEVSGTLREPLVQGALQVERGFLYLPPEFAPRETGEPIPINPRF
ncbi:MAG: translocation/assembly module TamB domain-containing protein, partial [Fimbriimonadales bacterium]|nr:translocation/assembly module TamB domain-containing protein [Fimbriimonadales bacterium]